VKFKLKKTIILLTLFLSVFSLAYSLKNDNGLIFDYTECKSYIYISFYANTSCKLTIPKLNKEFNFSKCEGKLKINKLGINSSSLNLIFKIGNKTIKEKVEIKNNFKYEILNKQIKLAGKEGSLYIKTNYPGFLIIDNEIFPLKIGENKINLYDLIRKNALIGKVPIKVKLCNQNYCRVFYDNINVESSPVKCVINVTENKFPHYLKFNFKVFDQRNLEYKPHIVYFDTTLSVLKENNGFIINFPKFYPSGNFTIKIIADGLTCRKVIRLNYSKFFYGYYSPIDEKLNKSKLFFIDPYKESLNITLKFDNESVNLTLIPNKIVAKELPIQEYCLYYDRKKFYCFKPQLVKENLLKNINNEISKVFLVIISVIVLLNIVIWLWGREKDN